MLDGRVFLLKINFSGICKEFVRKIKNFYEVIKILTKQEKYDELSKMSEKYVFFLKNSKRIKF